MIRRSSIFCVGAVVLLSFSPFKKVARKFIDPANMDLSVKPGDNFFLYANGNWMKRNPIPPFKTRWGNFNILADDNTSKLHILLEQATRNNSTDSKFQKIGDFYTSGMDSATIEKLGFEPIRNDLRRINNLSSITDIPDEMVYERINGITSPLISIYIIPDRKNSDTYIPLIGQYELTLPDRDYYVKNDARSINIREKFITFMQHLFLMTGSSETESKTKADAVLSMQTSLAKASLTPADLRNVNKTYNKFSWKSLSANTPNIEWKVLSSKMKINNIDSVVVENPAFVETLDSLLSKVSLTNWKAYLEWNVLYETAPFLSSSFVNENFKFVQALTGQKEKSQRWQLVNRRMDEALGDLLGELYINTYFKEEAKKRMFDLVNNLQQVFAERIKSLDWMSEPTKQKALEKLAAIVKKIGYGDKWRSYSGLLIKKDDYVGNIQRASVWSFDEMTAHIGKPVDKTIWNILPQSVAASYSPLSNDITFAAGILQFPFFDFEADDAVNYGAIGTIIGHEMTHGFDDQGSQYDLNGNLKDWWTKEDADKFKSKADVLVNEYNAFIVQDSLHVNGRLTLGENLADLGGLNIAFEAFTKTQQFKEGKEIDGFTPAQRFFLSFAQVWRTNILPEEEARRLIADKHAPAIARVNEPLRNIDAWYNAFNIQPGDKLYNAEDKRMKIW
jgi:putative endopeptidase